MDEGKGKEMDEGKGKGLRGRKGIKRKEGKRKGED